MSVFRNKTDFEQASQARRVGRSRKPLPILIAIVAVVAYLIPIGMFLSERHVAHEPAIDTAHDVALELKITVADFVKGVVTFHVVPTGGRLMKANGRLAQDVTLDTDPGTGPVTHVFKHDVPLTPWILSVAPDSGDILDYPFDHYTLELEFGARAGEKPAVIATTLEDVPHGFKAHLEEVTAGDGQTAIHVQVSRTGTIIFVALLSTVSLLLVSVAACAVAWQVAYRGRKIEFSMMVWVAALLFVIPTVRNGLPGGAPTGAVVDFLIFFWLQIAVVVAMSSLVLTWIRRVG